MQTHPQQGQAKIHSGANTRSWARMEDAHVRPVHKDFGKWFLMKFYVQVGSRLFNIILLS